MSFYSRCLSSRGRAFGVVKIILESVLISIEPITLLTDVGSGSCMTKLSGLLELLICLELLDHPLHMALIFLVLLLINL